MSPGPFVSCYWFIPKTFNYFSSVCPTFRGETKEPIPVRIIFVYFAYWIIESIRLFGESPRNVSLFIYFFIFFSKILEGPVFLIWFDFVVKLIRKSFRILSFLVAQYFSINFYLNSEPLLIVTTTFWHRNCFLPFIIRSRTIGISRQRRVILCVVRLILLRSWSPNNTTIRTGIYIYKKKEGTGKQATDLHFSRWFVCCCSFSSSLLWTRWARMSARRQRFILN